MSYDTITFAIGGTVTLDLFAIEMNRVGALVASLREEVAAGLGMDWVLEDVHLGSAVTTWRGISDDQEGVSRVIHAYERVGEALEGGAHVPFAAPVRRAALALLKPVNKKVTELRFETAEREFTIGGNLVTFPTGPRRLVAYGAIEGRVQTLTNRGGLRFTLYDMLNDRAISCYLDEGKQDVMRDAWGQRVNVQGLITRDALDGRPTAIRHISRVEPVSEPEPGAFLRARGILKSSSGEAPEELIRRVRDAW